LTGQRDERIALLRDDDGRVDDATIAQWQATVDGLQARIEELARERDEARAEAAGLRAECEKRGLPVSAAALARHERNSGITEGGFNQIAVEAAEAALATEIESHENTARQLEAAEQQAERYKADRNILKVRAQRHRADAEKLRAALRIAADEAGHERQPGHLERCCPVCTALQSTPSEGTSHGTGAS
jgi:chromosome segregation ATPase